MELFVVGLGVREGELTQDAMALLRAGKKLVLRTGQCAAADWLRAQHIEFETLDALYEGAEDFDALNAALTASVTCLAQAQCVVYGVLDLRDESAVALSKVPGTVLIPGVPVDGRLTGLFSAPCATLAAADLDEYQPEAGMATLVREITSREFAGEVKLRLMERYPEEQIVTLLDARGALVQIPLDELDRQARYDHQTAVFVPAERDLGKLERYGFAELNRIMRILRGPNGCPWDGAQTHESLRKYAIEEAWEVSDAIERGDAESLYDELGDLLLQVVFQADIARQHGEFCVDDTTSAICRKMIARHPALFNPEAGAPRETWDQMKMREKHLTEPIDALRSVTRGLPALMRAEKVLERAEKAGWTLDGAGENAARTPSAAWDFADESAAKALGEQLLRAVDQARRAGISAEKALTDAVNRLIERFGAGMQPKNV
ncbi:MAG: MazG family protein [Clostridia bacterium]